MDMVKKLKRKNKVYKCIIIWLGIPMAIIGIIIVLGCVMRKYICPWADECDFYEDDCPDDMSGRELSETDTSMSSPN